MYQIVAIEPWLMEDGNIKEARRDGHRGTLYYHCNLSVKPKILKNKNSKLMCNASVNQYFMFSIK